ncbi:hypothetical protein [Methylocystis hirsuta]|uniref:hypothetical protein n=1 Tax=Methylocystis hirsuta TaxID=369798 RepID=UPI0011CE6015|nr:hypothetical protein [Methylocystis hirsuta]
METVEYFRLLLSEYCSQREDFLFALIKSRGKAYAGAIDDVLAERAMAASGLQVLSERRQEILNEQRVSRQDFDEAARSFMQHERRKIEIEERQIFPLACSVLVPAGWADILAREKSESESQNVRQLKKRPRAQRRWVAREALAGQTERSGGRYHAATQIRMCENKRD